MKWVLLWGCSIKFCCVFVLGSKSQHAEHAPSSPGLLLRMGTWRSQGLKKLLALTPQKVGCPSTGVEESADDQVGGIGAPNLYCVPHLMD